MPYGWLGVLKSARARLALGSGRTNAPLSLDYRRSPGVGTTAGEEFGDRVEAVKFLCDLLVALDYPSSLI